jgi:hypothetical protein
MKTIQEYLNDPRILNDPGLMDGPEEIRKIHAARLMLQDETAGMTIGEQTDYMNKKAADILDPMGVSISPGFPGQGKLKPRVAVTQ